MSRAARPARAGTVTFSCFLLLFRTSGASAATRTIDGADMPILMYHVIADPPARARHVELFVSRTDFNAQMHWLHSHGYGAVTLREAYDFWFHGGWLPLRPIVVSFDDGYLSQHVNALPIRVS